MGKPKFNEYVVILCQQGDREVMSSARVIDQEIERRLYGQRET